MAVGNLSKNLSKRDKAKDARLRREFNVTLEQYNQVLKAQGGVCAICRKKYNKKGKPLQLSVDHCHTSGLVRGLLCWPCNKGIAVFQDNVESMYNGYKYLDMPPFVAALGKEIYSAPGRVGSAKRNKLISKMRKDGKKK